MVSNVIWKWACPHTVQHRPSGNAGLSPVRHCSLAVSLDCECPKSRETVLSIFPASTPVATAGTWFLLHEYFMSR